MAVISRRKTTEEDKKLKKQGEISKETGLPFGGAGAGKNEVIKKDSVAITPSGETVVNAPLKDDNKLIPVTQLPPLTISEQQQQRIAEQSGAINETPVEQQQLVEPITTLEGQIQATKEFYREGEIQKSINERLKGKITPELEAAGGINLAVRRGMYTIGKFGNDTINNAIKSAAITFDTIGGKLPFISDILSTKRIDKIKSSLQNKNQIISSTVSDYEEGFITFNEAVRRINILENDTNTAEEIIQQRAILSPSIRSSGELLDVQTDFQELRIEIGRARTAIFNTAVKQPTPEDVAFRLENLRK